MNNIFRHYSLFLFSFIFIFVIRFATKLIFVSTLHWKIPQNKNLSETYLQEVTFIKDLGLYCPILIKLWFICSWISPSPQIKYYFYYTFLYILCVMWVLLLRPLLLFSSQRNKETQEWLILFSEPLAEPEPCVGGGYNKELLLLPTGNTIIS